MSLAPLPIPRRATAALQVRGASRRAIIQFEDAKYASRGRDMLTQALASTRLGGRFVAGDLTDKQRRRLVGNLIRDARSELDHLTRRLDEGSLSLASWHRKAAELLATGHHAAALAGLGRTGLDAAERADVHATLRRELGYLARFRGEMQAGLVDTGAMAAARARMYGSALWGGAEASRRGEAAREGNRYGLRALGGSERSCERCPELAAMGWRPIDDIPAIGDTPCRSSCRCYVVYRKEPPGDAA